MVPNTEELFTGNICPICEPNMGKCTGICHTDFDHSWTLSSLITPPIQSIYMYKCKWNNNILQILKCYKLNLLPTLYDPSQYQFGSDVTSASFAFN